MEISKFTGLSDADAKAGASTSSRNDFEAAYEQQHSYLRGAWEGWKLREPEIERLKDELAKHDSKINSLLPSHTISVATGAILSALFFIGFMPNDHASRAEREFNNCLEKSSPADSAAIQACRDAANSIHEIHAKQPSR